MKVLLIAPGNIYFIPYINNYINILNKNNIRYDILNWDREGIEEPSMFRYYSKSNRNIFVRYKRYSTFIKKHLKNHKYDKIIVFGIQLLYFLRRTLSKTKIPYIVDIRDDNVLRRFFNFKKALNKSKYIVLSSKKYGDFIPKSLHEKILINHNLKNIPNDFVIFEPTLSQYDTIMISAIGSLRDEQINKMFIEELKNSTRIQMGFHGKSIASNRLKEYSKTKLINNINFTGRYYQKEEERLYCRASMINTLRFPDSYNNIMALPNKLYLAAYYGKPLLAYKGTYLSQIIEKYNLGLVINDFKNLENQIGNYKDNFDSKKFKQDAYSFISKCISENNDSNKKIKFFLLKK